MNRNIYVREDDVELWQRGQAYARARRLTMSALLMNALQAYLDDVEDTGADDATDR